MANNVFDVTTEPNLDNLYRIALVFKRRQIALQAISMVEKDNNFRIEITTTSLLAEDDAVRIKNQLNKIIEVISVEHQCVDSLK